MNNSNINEAYIINLSKYMHLLSTNEIFQEIKKVKAFIDYLREAGYNEKNKKDSFKKAINAINSLSQLYFQKVFNNNGILVFNLPNEILSIIINIIHNNYCYDIYISYTSYFFYFQIYLLF